MRGCENLENSGFNQHRSTNGSLMDMKFIFPASDELIISKGNHFHATLDVAGVFSYELPIRRYGDCYLTSSKTESKSVSHANVIWLVGQSD